MKDDDGSPGRGGSAAPAADRFGLGLVDPTFLRPPVELAQGAILELWQPQGTFWRSTLHRSALAGKGDGSLYPTVSLRSMLALHTVFQRAPDWTLDSTATFLRKKCDPKLSEWGMDVLLASSLGKVGTHPNLFTLSLYLEGLGPILRDLQQGDERARLEARYTTGANQIIGHPNVQSDQIRHLHPFLGYHAKRGVQSAASSQLPTEVSQGLRQTARRLDESARSWIERALAMATTETLTPSGVVATCFAGATLSLGDCDPSCQETPFEGWTSRKLIPPEDFHAVWAALRVTLEEQDHRGCWPLIRVAEYLEKDVTNDRIEVSTFEVMEAAAVSAIRMLHDQTSGSDPSIGQFLGGTARQLMRSARYAERSMVRLDAGSPPVAGWCGELSFGSKVIESWTTAAVLEALVRYSDFTTEFNRRMVLATFTQADPQDRDWPMWLRWTKLLDREKSLSRFGPLQYLETNLVLPTRRAPGGLPPIDPRSVSVLLFGPPGTSKTTIVKAVADALGWPVVVLSPGNFIERGLEYIEAQTEYVFYRLLKLSRAVVLFDECDELFRDRAPTAETEQLRGITAFITGSMLPRLQELHDRGRVLFFICTNKFETMDPAVRRGGRVDHTVAVGPPGPAEREMIVKDCLDRLVGPESWTSKPFMRDAVEELSRRAERFTRAEIERAARHLAQAAGNGLKSSEGARSAAEAIVLQMVPGLTIREGDYKTFLQSKKAYGLEEAG